MNTGEICKEARGLRGSLANPKIIHRIGCRNVRVTSGMEQYSIGSVSSEVAVAGDLRSAESEL